MVATMLLLFAVLPAAVICERDAFDLRAGLHIGLPRFDRVQSQRVHRATMPEAPRAYSRAKAPHSLFEKHRSHAAGMSPDQMVPVKVGAAKVDTDVVGSRAYFWVAIPALVLLMVAFGVILYRRREMPTIKDACLTSEPDRQACGEAAGQAEQAAPPVIAESGAATETAVASSLLEEQVSMLRKEKLKVLVEGARSKQRLEDLTFDISALEEQMKNAEEGSPAPTNEMIMQKAFGMIEATDATCERQFARVFSVAYPLMNQGHKVVEAWDKHIASVRAKAVGVALEETQGFCDDVRAIFAVEDVQDRIVKALDRLEITSIAVIVASACAPLQLKLLHVSNCMNLCKVFLLTIVSTVVLLTDRDLCNAPDRVVLGKVTPRQLYIWFIVDAAIGSFCLVVRLWAHLNLREPVEALKTPPPAHLNADSLMKGAMELLDYYITTGLEALQALDRILKSLFFVVVQWTDIFCIAWLGYACILVFDGVWGQECHPVGLAVLGCRVVVFFVMLVPRLATLVTFILSRLMPRRSFQVLILAWAYQVDEFLQLGVPVVVLLVQAFLIRDWQDIVSLQIRLYEIKKVDLKAKEREAQDKLSQASAALKRQNSRIKYLRKVEAKSKCKQDSHDARQRLQRDKQDIVSEAEAVLTRLNGHVMKVVETMEAQVEQLQAGRKPDMVKALEAQGQRLATEIEEHRQAVQALIAEGNLQSGMEDAAEALKVRADEAVERGRAAVKKGKEACRGVLEPRAREAAEATADAELVEHLRASQRAYRADQQ